MQGKNRGVDTGLKSCLKIHKDLKISENSKNNSEIYDNSSTILKWMDNSLSIFCLFTNRHNGKIHHFAIEFVYNYFDVPHT
jgi:hypothetical protein